MKSCYFIVYTWLKNILINIFYFISLNLSYTLSVIDIPTKPCVRHSSTVCDLIDCIFRAPQICLFHSLAIILKLYRRAFHMWLFRLSYNFSPIIIWLYLSIINIYTIKTHLQNLQCIQYTVLHIKINNQYIINK